MKNAILGGVLGALIGAGILATGGSGSGATSAALTQAEFDLVIAQLEQEIDDLQSGVNGHGRDLDAHAADEVLHLTDTAYMGLNYCINRQGIFPSRSLIGEGDTALDPSDDYLSGVGIFAGDFVPPGYTYCEGQLLPVSQNNALFSLLGTFYGGDGRTTLALPDLRNRVPMHPSGSTFRLGQRRN